MKSVFKNIFHKSDKCLNSNYLNSNPLNNKNFSILYNIQAMNFARNVKLRAHMYRNMNIEEFDIKKVDIDDSVTEKPIDFNKKDFLDERDILLKHSQSREYVRLATKWQKTLIDRKRLKRNNKRNLIAHVRFLLKNFFIKFNKILRNIFY